MNRYIYVVRPGRPDLLTAGPTADEAKIISEHFAYIEALYKKGQIEYVGRTLATGEKAMGLVVFSAKDDDEADRVMKGDPAVKNAVMTATCAPFKVIFPPAQ
jgi:uncharacterized protein